MNGSTANRSTARGAAANSKPASAATANGTTAYRSTAPGTVREGRLRRPRTAWELPDLIRPLPVRHRPVSKQPRLLPHYPAVVEFVYNHRFATGLQIKQRFPAYMRAERTRCYQLSSLVQLGYLATASVRSTAPNFPYVYFATRRGINLIKSAYADLGVDWSGTATEQIRSRGLALTSILHEILLTEFDLMMQRSIESRGDLRLLLTERRFFRRDKQLRFWHENRIRQVVPDSGYVIRRGGESTAGTANEGPMMYFVEFDNGSMSVARLREKYERYEQWSRSEEADQYFATVYGRETDSSRPSNFRLLVVAHANRPDVSDRRRLLDLFTPLLSLSSRMRDRVWLTTAEQLRRCQAEPQPMATPIWLRARDARSWMGEYHTMLARRQRGSGHKLLTHQRRFVAERLDELPQHAVLGERPS